ncbi:hypothetical protein C7S20_14130 [Christiangramia fulva]|uniref:Uncharacterized protein n=1 Tax=Christiangramia fulva TaxID=2126553 RepID=A0A2R3Z7Q8_9FLAO|nr:DUF6155 family protein [Christiangramia fulva]AVR46310.1 hypothetical protein C7S20_14130 [Christiangramia fulva]
MSKRAFKKYLKSLKKKDLEDQLTDLYERFPEVKTFYDFVFNPQEEKLVREAKAKISKEYFPKNRRKAKGRRSVAHKYIRHFLKLEMEPHALADLMLYNIEIAQAFAEEKDKITPAFEKSMFNSFEQATEFIISNGIVSEFAERIHRITEATLRQNWGISYKFEKLNDRFL